MKKISIEVAIQINEEFSAICKKFPDKFGFVVTIPIPSVEGSIKEIKFSTEKLGALGVKVASNFDGIYSATKLKFWKILPEKVLQFKEKSWGCVIAMLAAASKGKISAFQMA